MIPFLELAEAVSIIFPSGIEFVPQSFKALSGEKLEAYLRNVGPMTEIMYEIVAMEPTVIDRVGDEKVTWELNIVTGKERQQLLDGVKFIYRATEAMPGKPSFQERLDWLKPKLPPVITAGQI